MNQVISKAPGRVCLFGDHQDYLGLPIIACAINRFVEIHGMANDSEEIFIEMPDIKTSRSFHIHDPFDHLEKGDHIASVVRVVRRYGCVLDKGYTITIKGDVPINAGLSSSSAVVVAWIRFLLDAFGCNQKITDELVAKFAYEAEVVEYNSPGGRMDQYTIAIGDIIFLETGDSAKYKKIERSLSSLVIGESGIPKNTMGLLSDLKRKALDSIEAVLEYDLDFNLHSAVLEDIDKYSDIISEELQPFFYSSIKNHMITREALAALNEETLNYERIGALMNEHHSVLKNILKITTPKIDNMIEAALEAGAYGAKIVGSGGGGSICAISSKQNKQRVIDNILAAGAKDAYAVSVTSGKQFIIS
jgi:galactokinase